MIELGEAEPAIRRPKIEKELDARSGANFSRNWTTIELQVFLNGPHDKNNCILSINAGAGGTEACDWANMLLRMYQRWAEWRGWQVEVTDALPGETAGIKSATLLIRAKTPTAFAKPSAGCTGWCAFRRSIPTSGGTPVLRAWMRLRKLRRTPRKSKFRRMNLRWIRFVPAAKAGRT